MVVLLLVSVLLRITVLASHWTTGEKEDLTGESIEYKLSLYHDSGLAYPVGLSAAGQEHYDQVVHLLWFLKPVTCFVCSACALIYMIVAMVFTIFNLKDVNANKL